MSKLTKDTKCKHKNMKCCRYTGFTYCDDCGYWHSWIEYRKSPHEMFQMHLQTIGVRSS